MIIGPAGKLPLNHPIKAARVIRSIRIIEENHSVREREAIGEADPVCGDQIRADVNFKVGEIADVMEINAAQLHIEFVEHAIIADTKFEFRTALQSLVRESFQPRAHLIHLALNGFTDG